MARIVLRLVIATGALAALTLFGEGCNDVLGIPDVGRMASDAEANGQCGPGEKACGGNCVSILNPATSCAAKACSPCDLPHGSAVCVTGACALSVCELGWADCNGDPSDGCEAELASDPAHCGACDVKCMGALECVSSSCACTRDEECGGSGSCDTGVCTCGGDTCDPGVTCDLQQCN